MTLREVHECFSQVQPGMVGEVRAMHIGEQIETIQISIIRSIVIESGIIRVRLGRTKVGRLEFVPEIRTGIGAPS